MEAVDGNPASGVFDEMSVENMEAFGEGRERWFSFTESLLTIKVLGHWDGLAPYDKESRGC